MKDEQIEKLMSEVFDSKQNEMNKFMDDAKKQDDKINTIYLKIGKNVQKNCPKEFEWLQKNFDSASEKERKPKLEEFKKCSDQNDFGFNNYMDAMKKQYDDFANKDRECFRSCAAATSEDKAKSCMHSCIDKSISESRVIMTSIGKKLDEFNSKI
jgi:hypothetical protein